MFLARCPAANLMHQQRAVLPEHERLGSGDSGKWCDGEKNTLTPCHIVRTDQRIRLSFFIELRSKCLRLLDFGLYD